MANELGEGLKEIKESESKYWTERIEKGAIECGIPEHMIDGIVKYVVRKVPPGSFLTAVLSNDFMAAVGRADYMNQSSLAAYGMFIYNYMPPTSHGSREIVDKWLKA